MLRICNWCDQGVEDSEFEIFREFRTEDILVTGGRAHALDRVKIEPPDKTNPAPNGTEVEEPELEEVEAKSAE
jgi:hypothetical protein